MILELDATPAASAGAVGAKVARLLLVRDLGLRIAAGFVVTADALAEWDDGLGAEIAARSVGLAGGGPLVVRTSALDEDAAEASFAGQYESRLGVPAGEAVVEAVHACRAGLRSDRVAAYRAAGDREPAGAAVAVQRQVAPWRGGVAFSADPVRGTRDRMVVECAPDTTTATSGEADPERTDLDKSTGRVLRGEGALRAAHLLVLRDAVVAIEAALGCPVDVEWALETESPGSLVILQARPITALPPQPTWP